MVSSGFKARSPGKVNPKPLNPKPILNQGSLLPALSPMLNVEPSLNGVVKLKWVAAKELKSSCYIREAI